MLYRVCGDLLIYGQGELVGQFEPQFIDQRQHRIVAAPSIILSDGYYQPPTALNLNRRYVANDGIERDNLIFQGHGGCRCRIILRTGWIRLILA